MSDRQPFQVQMDIANMDRIDRSIEAVRKARERKSLSYVDCSTLIDVESILREMKRQYETAHSIQHLRPDGKGY